MKWENYKVVQSYECLNSCIVGYLYNYGNAIAAEDIFFIGGGYKLSVEIEEIPTIGAELYQSNFRFMELMGIKYKLLKANNRTEAEQILSNCKKEGYPLSIKVSSEFLTHNRVFSQTEGSPHYLNILCDNVSDLWIADGYVPTREPSVFLGNVERGVILNAWKKMDYQYFVAEYDGFFKDSKEINELSDKCFEEALKKFIEQNAGYEMFQKVFQYIYDLFKKQPDKGIIRETFVKINYHLKIYGFITTKRYGLEKIKKVICNKNLIQQYEDVIKNWNKICMLLLKVGYSNKIEQFKKVEKTICDSINQEKMLLCQILEEFNKERKN